MIGNDVVDLSVACGSSRILETRYLDKIFSKQEQAYIRKGRSPEESLWLLWSMKESAYKIFLKTHKKLFYNSLTFCCKVIDEEKGSVTINDEYYYTFSVKTKNFIHTIALENRADTFRFDFTKLNNATYEDQHRAGHAKLKAVYAANAGIDASSLKIRKDTLGIPELYLHKRKTNLAFSISHHGYYAAVAMLTSPKPQS